MRYHVTLAAAKAASRLSRVMGRGGGQALPGVVAEKFDPKVAAQLARQLPGGVVMVTGTNGKTTTTKLIREILEADNLSVATNATGSNLKRGVVSALVAATDARGRVRGDIGLFEVDEANVRLVAPLVQPRAIVVTNLFRDQLDRYGELDSTARLIGEGIAACDAEVFLNADDPLVASLASYAKDAKRVHYFGIEGAPVNPVGQHQTAIDSDRCPKCRSRLDFSRVFYGHIGHYRCPKGDFSRPAPSVVVTNVESADQTGTEFVLALEGRRTALSVPLPGTYNLYNALAAISLGTALGAGMEKIGEVLARTTAAFGRVERVQIDGRTLCLLLIKNPAGFTQVLQTFVIGTEAVRVLFVVNDLAADGRDVSWLWDVPLEALAGSRDAVFTTGIRGADMALRLKYAGLAPVQADSVAEGIAAVLAATPVGGTAYVLPTYTAMLEVRKVLSGQVAMAEMGS